MSEQLFRAARAVVATLPADPPAAWQGTGVLAVPIPLLLDLQEAVQAPDIRRMSCSTCGTKLGIGEPVQPFCGREGCREQYEGRVWRGR